MTSPDQWNAGTFTGLSDLDLMRLLAAIGSETRRLDDRAAALRVRGVDDAVVVFLRDPSDEAFMEAIRRELVQRSRVREGKPRTWGEVQR